MNGQSGSAQFSLCKQQTNNCISTRMLSTKDDLNAMRKSNKINIKY
jgi:hypothetical protein